MKLSPARLTRKTPAGFIAFALLLGVSACIDNVKPADPLAEDQILAKGEYIEVIPDVAELAEIGDRIKLEAAVRDSRGRLIPGATVTWQAADPGVATVDASGNVTGVGEGMTEIHGTNGSLSSAAVIAVAKKGIRWGGGAKTTVALSPDEATISTVGGTTKLLAVGRNAGGHLVSGDKMEWGSTDPSVATVSQGVVTGKSSGQARIIVVNGGAADTASVAVAPPNTPATVVVSPAADTIPTIGGTVELIGQVLNGSGTVLEYSVTWSSLDPSVATVSSGTVTGVAKGIARIRGAYGSLADTARIWVGQTATATSIFVLPKVDTIAQVGGTAQITATALDGNGAEIQGAVFTWNSMDPSVATVDGTGSVKGISQGNARIIARLGTLVDTATVVVAPTSPTVAAAAITIAPQVDTIPTLGTWAFLTATVKDAQGKTINVAPEWKSLDPTVASVGTIGEVKGLAEGMARITASIGDLADTAAVYIATSGSTGGGASIQIVPDTATIQTVGGKAFFMAVMKDSAGNTVTTKPAWATLDPTLVSVNGEGDVQGLAKGTARITATWSGVSDTAQVFVAPGTTISASLSVSHSPSSPS
ncbi:MAG: Ig-like domain-containing protein, partial [Gemmatimonadota bacterium]